MKHTGTVRLETERLILRRFTTADDAAMFNNWASDPDVTEYMTWQTHDSIDVSLQILNEWICGYQKPDFYQWGIALKDTGTLIGSIGLAKQDDKTKTVNVGYCIGKSWWRKGYTSEALTRLVRFFFEEVGVNRIEANHDRRNPNSGRVMQKAGLRYEGTFLESVWNKQCICDAVYYAILARDYFHKPQQAKVAQATFRNADISDIDVVTNLSYELYHPMCGLEREELLQENQVLFNNNRQKFILAIDMEKPIGVAHVSLRSDYTNGIELGGTYGYLEAIYVKPEYRMSGIAAALVRLCEEWAKEHGCREFASDCMLDNTDSYRFHLRIGFAETERCIFFRKDI